MLKKLFALIILLILLFLSLVVLGPQLLGIDTVRTKVAEMISAKSGWQVDAAQLDLYWLPTPHFSIHDTSIESRSVRLFIPETRIFPVWSSLLRQKVELRKINLIRPEIRINSLSEEQERGETFIPQTQITVTDGSVVIEKSPLISESHLFPLTIEKIDGTIDLAPEKIGFRTSSESRHFSHMDLEGLLNPNSLEYEFEYEISGLNFYNLLPTMRNEKLLPVKSPISMSGKVRGNGTENFQASLSGDFPCFVAPSETESFLLDCGNVELVVDKNNGNLSIDLKELQLKNPGMTLRGEIARLIPESPGPDKEPVWLIDLSGEEIDLTSLRKGVLTLWPDNSVSQTVTEIVLGGKARRASYYFKAPTSGFHDITKMKIVVDVEESEIKPPATPLLLENASGPIEIIDGYLSGTGLSARTNGNRGENCSLLLDLAHRNRDFTLDLDIDADLADLQKVLLEMFHHAGFRRETARFDKIEGRATGHLHVGKTLDHPKVTVQVSSINGGAVYEPLPHPFRIRSGSIDVYPDKVEWHGIKGVIGPHLVREITGEVLINENPSIEIKAAQATFDSTALLTELKRAALLPEKIASEISEVEGIIELNRGSFKGRLKDRDKWLYSLEISTSGSRWTSSLLPRPILAERLRAEISRNRIDLNSGKIWFLEQPLLIEGSFSHVNLADWHSWIMLSGTIREPLADWIRKKNWLPEDYFPVIPCTLDQFRVDWGDENIKLSGGIAAGMGGVTSPFVRLKLESDKKRLKIDKLTVSSPEEQGSLTLDYLKDESRQLDAKWQGFLNTGTTRQLLQKKDTLPAKRVEGDFTLNYSAVPPLTVFRGWAKIENLDWLFNNSRKNFLFKKLDVVGNAAGNSFKINEAVIGAADEELMLNGQATIDSEKVSFDLGLDTELITSQTWHKILEDIGVKTDQTSTRLPDQQEKRNISGVLHFQAGTYRSVPEAGPNEKAAPDKYTLSPAIGFFTIDSAADKFTLDLRNSNLCDLNISATLNLKDSLQNSSLNLFTDSSAPPLFENVIPCLGFENTLIDGAFHLDVNIEGAASTWQKGNIDLYGTDGYIHKLSFLSKVFRVVNLRDLFSGAKLPDFADKGFAYSKMEIKGHVDSNKLVIDKAIIDGEGLNIYGQGSINMDNWTADLILMIAPLKTVDAVITNIPLIGKVAGGTDKAVISIPVAVKGNLRDPKVNILPPEAIGQGLLNLIENTLMMPFQILSPLLPETENNSPNESQR